MKFRISMEEDYLIYYMAVTKIVGRVVHDMPTGVGHPWQQISGQIVCNMLVPILYVNQRLMCNVHVHGPTVWP